MDRITKIIQETHHRFLNLFCMDVRHRNGEASEYCQQHIKNIAHIAHDRHQDIGISIGRCHTVTKLLIFLIKNGLGFFFMAEYLDNLLAIDHFFNIAIHVTDILLLFNKVDTALSGNGFHNF